MEKNLIHMKKENLVLFITIAIILIGSAYCYWIIDKSHIYGYQDTGPLGDTIAGIVGTCINLCAAFLVYFSFREQIKANSELSKQLLDERSMNILMANKDHDFIQKSLNDFKKFNKMANDIFENNFNNTYKIFGNNIFELHAHMYNSIKENLFEWKEIILALNLIDSSKRNPNDLSSFLKAKIENYIKPIILFKNSFDLSDDLKKYETDVADIPIVAVNYNQKGDYYEFLSKSKIYLINIEIKDTDGNLLYLLPQGKDIEEGALLFDNDSLKIDKSRMGSMGGFLTFNFNYYPIVKNNKNPINNEIKFYTYYY